MNLVKVYAVLFVVLLVCTLESDGGIIIGLLIKLIALKGALFLGTPIALGAFLMGQGVGFFAGNLAGGYAVLKAAQKFHEREKAKWKSPTKGWGWDKGSSLYGKGYNKGYGLGSIVSDFLSKQKGWGWKPEHGGHSDYDHDYHDDHHHGYKAGHHPTHLHYYPPPSSSYGYGSYSGSPAYYSPPHSHGYQRKTPSMMERIIGRIPGVSAIFGANKGHSSSYSPENYDEYDYYGYGYGEYPASINHGAGSYASPPVSVSTVNANDGYNDGSSAYSFKGQDPMNTYQPGIFSSPIHSDPPKYKAVAGGGYSFAEGYKAAKEAERYHPSA